MTEQNLGQNISGDSNFGSSAPSAPAAHQTEEMIPKSRATQLIKERGDERYSAGYERARQELSAQQQAQAQPNTQQPHSSPDIGVLKKQVADLEAKVKDDEDKRQAREQAAQQYAAAAQIGAQLRPKVEIAKQKYDDFEQVVNSESIGSNGELLAFANEVDNAGEVLYEVVSSPERLAQFRSLKDDDYNRRRLILGISKALKNNEASANIKVPKSPISQPQASNVKVNNGGQKPTIAELRRKFTV